ncbi:DUF4188 domain-containing protein [Cyanobacteria bacterium FACHB-471]|nr:DUF4188 domain-containing protein [Cyanobacteria bacterium FACHB-471]
MMSAKGYSIYQVDLPEHPQAVVFVNGMLTRDRPGFFWMWKNLTWIKSSTVKAEGCVQVKAGICSPNEVIVVSYWRSEQDLKQFFRGEAHRHMMQFVMKNPDSLCLYNETYRPEHSGKYSHEPQGMATLYASLTSL